MVSIDQLQWQRDIERKFPGYWAKQAFYAIYDAHQSLAEDADLATRKAAIDAVYPFGPREMHPYKQWLKVRRWYLEQFGYESKGKPHVGKPRVDTNQPKLIAESPLERMMRRAGK